VQDDEDVVGVGADLGDGVALHARLDRESVEPEGLRQHLGGRLVAVGDVHPDQLVPAGQQPQLLDRMLWDTFLRYEADAYSDRHTSVHPGTSLNSVPTPVGTAATGAAA
jgi:hypothetical protein